MIDVDGDEYRLGFLPARGPSWEAPLQGGVRQLRDARATAIDALTALKAKLFDWQDTTGFVGRWEPVDDAMKSLDQLSISLLQELLQPNPAEELFRLLHTLHIAVKSAESSGLRPFIDISCTPATILPFEILPLTDELPVENILDAQDLGAAAGRFIGFRTSTRVTFRGVPLPSVAEHDNLERLRALVLRDASLNHADREVCDLGGFGAIDLLGPMPEEGCTSKDFLAMLVHDLLGSVDDIGGAVRIADLVHVISHCETDSTEERSHRFSFAGTPAESSRFWVEARDLESALLAEQRRRYAIYGNLPASRPALVFANACGSARLSLEGSGRFPRFFVNRAGVPTYIGPLVSIPDQVAASFSPYVYRHLMDGVPVAHALSLARSEFLHDYRNPLSIVYTMFGFPDTTITTSD
ncbi:MAG: CHAT domain-containing protein [Actinomycetota bacterium]|nr:CHAT domain-containing protein [Actinomycetota bacterium]